MVRIGDWSTILQAARNTLRACRVAAAADRHAEARKNERKRKHAHRVEIAADERFGRIEQQGFVWVHTSPSQEPTIPESAPHRFA